MIKSDRQRLQKIIETGHRLIRFLSENHITPEKVLEDYTIQWTITTPLYNIGEHTYHVSKELKAVNPDIHWSQVSGLRHRLVHNYDDTNWSIVNIVVFEELTGYISALEKLLNTEE